MKHNKKALSETVAFIFLTLLIVVVSLTVYSVLTGIMDGNIKEFDKNNMEIYLKKMNFIIDEISTFDGVSKSLHVDFNYGQLGFAGNEVSYQSLTSFEGNESYCFENLCYSNSSGFEKLYFNMSSYNFSFNFSLVPGSYVLVFTHLKNESEINVRIR